MKTKYGNLELEEDMSFQQRSWKVERAGWVLMALILLASTLGLIDKGPLSRTRKATPGPWKSSTSDSFTSIPPLSFT